MKEIKGFQTFYIFEFFIEKKILNQYEAALDIGEYLFPQLCLLGFFTPVSLAGLW